MSPIFSRCRTVALASVAAFLLCAGSAHATVVTYDFTGTLSTPLNGGTGVSGSFTVDNVADTIINFSLTTPVGSATPSNTSATVAQFLGVQPNADFTDFSFNPINLTSSPIIILLFESSLAN